MLTLEFRLPNLEPGSPLAVDIETTGGLHHDPPEDARVAVVAIAWQAGNMVSRIQSAAYAFAFSAAKGNQMALLFEEQDPNLSDEDWYELLGWLRGHRLIFHNAKFDLGHLWTGTPRCTGFDLSLSLEWDTAIASRDLDAGMAADLEAIEKRMGYFSPETRREWLASKKGRAHVGRLAWKDAHEYACWDAEATFAAWERQMERYDFGEGDRVGMDEELALTRVLVKMEHRGIGYDVNRSLAVAKEIKAAEAKIAVKLPFRATPHGARKYWFDTLGIDPQRRTPTGLGVVDEQQVSYLIETNAPFAREYAEHESLKSARTKWYEPYAQMTGYDGRLRTVYAQAKVVSGRLSSTRVNLQAIPRDYQITDVTAQWPSPRQLFKPRHGMRLWELDLSQAELRVAAVEAKCQTMIDMIKDGADIHGIVTQDVLGDEPGTPTWEENRQIGKRADFGLIFGLGPDTFQQDLAKYTGIYRPLGELSKIVYRWRRLYPEYGRAINRYQAKADKNHYIRLINGRIRRFATYEDRHKAFNQYVQGSLAEMQKHWMVRMEGTYPGVLLLTIHDSLVLETDEEGVVKACRRMAETIFENWFGIPMTVDVKEWKAA